MPCAAVKAPRLDSPVVRASPGPLRAGGAGNHANPTALSDDDDEVVGDTSSSSSYSPGDEQGPGHDNDDEHSSLADAEDGEDQGTDSGSDEDEREPVPMLAPRPSSSQGVAHAWPEEQYDSSADEQVRDLALD